MKTTEITIDPNYFSEDVILAILRNQIVQNNGVQIREVRNRAAALSPDIDLDWSSVEVKAVKGGLLHNSDLARITVPQRGGKREVSLFAKATHPFAGEGYRRQIKRDILETRGDDRELKAKVDKLFAELGRKVSYQADYLKFCNRIEAPVADYVGHISLQLPLNLGISSPFIDDKRLAALLGTESFPVEILITSDLGGPNHEDDVLAIKKRIDENRTYIGSPHRSEDEKEEFEKENHHLQKQLDNLIMSMGSTLSFLGIGGKFALLKLAEVDENKKIKEITPKPDGDEILGRLHRRFTDAVYWHYIDAGKISLGDALVNRKKSLQPWTNEFYGAFRTIVPLLDAGEDNWWVSQGDPYLFHFITSSKKDEDGKLALVSAIIDFDRAHIRSPEADKAKILSDNVLNLGYQEALEYFERLTAKEEKVHGRVLDQAEKGRFSIKEKLDSANFKLIRFKAERIRSLSEDIGKKAESDLESHPLYRAVSHRIQPYASQYISGYPGGLPLVCDYRCYQPDVAIGRLNQRLGETIESLDPKTKQEFSPVARLLEKYLL